jgi:MFS family permease
MLVAASILGPQLVVALLSPLVGRRAEQWGRRPLLVLCFAALTIRALFFSYSANPTLLIGVQLLDGVCGAVLAVLVPLIVADVAGDTGHFNLAQGAVGCAVGVGAAISTTAAGAISDRLGGSAAFLAMAAIGLLGLLAARFAMSETRVGAGGGSA